MSVSPYTEKSLQKQVANLHTSKYQNKIIQHLPAFSGMRHAAVLIPLFVRSGEVFILLTVRSSAVRTHKGDVAFPGGMQDKTDTDEFDTCLREAHEEIGLERDQVTLVAQIPPMITRYKVLMQPIIGIIPNDFKPIPNEEVAAVFELPLARFLSKSGLSYFPYTFNGQQRYTHIFQDTIDGSMYRTWGLTAHLCTEVAIGVLQRQPEFELMPGVQINPASPFEPREIKLKEMLEQQIQDTSKL